MKRFDTAEEEWTVKRDGRQLAALAARVMDEPTEPLVVVVNTAAGALVLPVPEGDVIHVGRSRECEVTISDVSVSRRHVRFFVREREIEDLGSANGSTYEGARLAPHTRTRIELGRAIGLGDVTMFLHAARSIVAPDAAPASSRIVTTAGHVVRDEALRKVYAMLPTIAPSPLSILILGETGVGKEVFADAVHRASPRTGKPFLKLNCAALPESILEGELFGYEKGAFSGAVTARPGLFESAHGGTVFLDEVGELTLPTQAKLLRVLESGEVLRLGSRTPTQVDVRFVAATNRDLEAAVAAGTFRRDLFYRLEGVRVFIPPLRERPEDIVALAEHFLTRLAQRMNLSCPRLTDAAKETLRDYAWPGNVRELRNVIERAFVMNPTVRELDDAHILASANQPKVTSRKPEPHGEERSEGGTRRGATGPTRLERSDGGVGRNARPTEGHGQSWGIRDPAEIEHPTATGLPAVNPDLDDDEDDDTGVSPRAPVSAVGSDLKASMNAMERQAILDALAKTGGNQSAAARLLGMGRHALIARIEAYGITRPRKK